MDSLTERRGKGPRDTAKGFSGAAPMAKTPLGALAGPFQGSPGAPDILDDKLPLFEVLERLEPVALAARLHDAQLGVCGTLEPAGEVGTVNQGSCNGWLQQKARAPARLPQGGGRAQEWRGRGVEAARERRGGLRGRSRLWFWQPVPQGQKRVLHSMRRPRLRQPGPQPVPSGPGLQSQTGTSSSFS